MAPAIGLTQTWAVVTICGLNQSVPPVCNSAI